MTAVCALALVVQVAGAARAAALDDESMPSVRQTWSHWYTIRGIAQTDDGYLWIATNDGLARFDGARFETLKLPQGPTNIAVVAVSARGAVFVVLVDGRLARVDSGALVLVGGGVRIADQEILAMAVDPGDRVWLGGAKGLFRWVPGESAERILPNSVRGLLAMPDGRLWAATDNGLFRQADAGFEIVGPPRHVTALATNRRGGLWALSGWGRGLSVDRILPQNAADHVPLPEGDGVVFTDLAVDAADDVWVSGTEVLLRIREGKIARRPLAFMPPKILVDREGSLWTGSIPGMLARLGHPWARVFGFEDGSGPAMALAVLETRDGSVWITSDEALARFHNGSVQRFGRGDLAGMRCPRSLAEDAHGNLWISNCDGAIYRLRDGALTTFGPREGLPAKPGLGNLVVDGEGTLWAGSKDRGLFALRDGRFVREPVVDTEIRSLIASREGGLWVGLRGQGLTRLVDGRARRYGQAEGLRHGFVNALHEGRDGTLWVGTRGGGIYRFSDGHFTALDDRAGFPAENINGLVEDGKGDLWVTTDAGLFRLPHGNRQARIRYGTEDGFTTERFSDGFNAPAMRSRDGRLWFPTNLGLAVIPAPEHERPRPLPRVVIEEIRSGASVHLLAGASAFRTADTGELAIRFTAPTFVKPQLLKTFQYRLEGHDPNWQDVGPERVARYVGLAPGRYSFQVRAASGADGEPAVAQAALQLTLDRPLRAWAYPAFGVAVAGLLAFAVQRLRVRQVRRRFAAVLAERNRIARDLHDSLAQGFAGIGYQLDHLDQSLADADAGARKALTVLRTLVRASRLEARQAIWNLRAEEPDGRPLAQRLRETAQQARLSSAAGVELTVDGQERSLSPVVEQELVRVAQEATTNALVHGRAQRVDILLTFEDEAVRLAVQDDGAGFEPTAAPSPETQHFGLAGMAERAARIGGTLQITSARGQGTLVTLVVARPAA